MNEYKCVPLGENVEEMFIGPFGSSLKNECFVDEDEAYCMVYEQKHAIQKTMDVETRYVNEQKYNELKRFNIHGGDIIVSCRGTIGETFIVPENAPLGIMHPSIMKIRLKDGVYDKYYFNLLLKSRLKKYEAEANGSGVKMAISATELGRELFPVPTMQEQQEITDIISGISDVIEKRKQELSALDNLIKARFVEMFGDIATGNYKYDTRKLGDVANVGSSHRAFTTEFVKKGIPFYRGTEIGELANGNKPEEPFYISEEHYNRLVYNDTKPQIGDLLLPSICNKGQVWMVDTNEPFYYKDGRVLYISPDREIFDTKYLEYFMKAKTLVEYPKLGSGSTFAEFKIFLLKDIDVLIPPRELQEQFSMFVNQVDKSKVAVQKPLDET